MQTALWIAATLAAMLAALGAGVAVSLWRRF